MKEKSVCYKVWEFVYAGDLARYAIAAADGTGNARIISRQALMLRYWTLVVKAMNLNGYLSLMFGAWT